MDTQPISYLSSYERRGPWLVQRFDDMDQTRFLDAILEMQLPVFYLIFNTTPDRLEPCAVFCDATVSVPILITNWQPIAIRLNIATTAYWCQVIYQLSHELCHYFIRQKKPDTDKTMIVRWFEETMCEAMSNYLLWYMAEHWSECVLSSMNASYDRHIRDYLSNLMNVYTPSAIQRCTTSESLRQLEKVCTAERDARSVERDLIFQQMRLAPYSAGAFAEYPRYVVPEERSQPDSRLRIDFPRWLATCEVKHLEMVRLLAQIHPNLPVN